MQPSRIGTMLPLLGLIAGTGTIAPEIDDGTIIHLLAKPISRPVIATTKFLVAASLLALFAAVPNFLAGYPAAPLDRGSRTASRWGPDRRHRLRGGVPAAGRDDPARGHDRHHLRAGLGGPGRRLRPRRAEVLHPAVGAVLRRRDVVLGVPPSVITLSFAVPALLIVTIGSVVWAGQRLRSTPSPGTSRSLPPHVRPLNRGRTCSVRI